MAIYAPVYKPRGPTQGTLAYETKKRKRDQDPTAATHDPSESPEAASPRRDSGFHPVNSTDPYFVAGVSRQDNLPLFPFPHAPVKGPSAPKVPLETELAALNPPLLSANLAKDDGNTSLKQRHLDNLATILHQCMLRDDWQRASRVWGLLIRTEIHGRGVDLRQHGRWGIGAEILLRRSESKKPPAKPKDLSLQDLSLDEEDTTEPAAHASTTDDGASNEGFALAKSYYERLILQYPHTPRTQRTINATVFYPALFNIWLYDVQARHKHRRSQASNRRSSSSTSAMSDDTEHYDAAAAALVEAELLDALALAHRMDEVLASPPYDSSIPLLQLRGMIGLWLADLHGNVAKSWRRASEDEGLSQRFEARVEAERYAAEAERERGRGVLLLRRVRDAGAGGREVERVLAGLQDVDALR